MRANRLGIKQDEGIQPRTAKGGKNKLLLLSNDRKLT
jgi:hypothetical protein